MIYAFERIDASLELLPFAARRALDHAGLKVSLASWKAMPLRAREQLAALGADATVDVAGVRRALSRAEAATEAIAPKHDPDPLEVPPELVRAMGYDIGVPTWRALSPLDRYVLQKVSAKPRGDRVTQAYNEIVLVPEPQPGSRPRELNRERRREGGRAGMTSLSPSLPVQPSALSSHLNARGEVRMVDVGEKEVTVRRAVAEARVTMDPATATRLREGRAAKGDVLATARIAGIQAAKKTPDLIPLCHAIALTSVEVQLEIGLSGVLVRATAEARDRTGVEMEAMVAASTAALTVYDMLKGVDRGMSFEVRLLEKSGGLSGLWKRKVP
jgi:molybdenum cofactor biosynthesis protein MoaC